MYDLAVGSGSDLLKCPFCPCFFCTIADLGRHLEVFGFVAVLHATRFRVVHGFDVRMSLGMKRSASYLRRVSKR
jgi:hypothetical protein